MSDAARHVDLARAIKVVGSQAELARRCKCAQQHISKLLNREVSISAEIAKAIDVATDGAVPCWLLRPDLWDAPQKEEAA